MADIINFRPRIGRNDARDEFAMLEATTNRPVSVVNIRIMRQQFEFDIDQQVFIKDKRDVEAMYFYSFIRRLIGHDPLEAWKTIESELLDPKWDFRTVEGLSTATGIPGDTINELLKSHKSAVR